MSRLIDELNRAARAAAQPMGFRATRPASSEARILLIASLGLTADTDRLADCVNGADAVVLHTAKSGLTAKMLKTIADILPDIPWGGWVEDTVAKKMETLTGDGCDFLVFPATSRILAAPQDDKIGKILQVEPSLSDGLLRTINDLPVDAVLIADTYEVGGSIAWHHLMQFQRLANLVTKPLLVSALLSVTASELKALWDAEVDGMVVEADTSQPGGLKELRRLISELSPRSPHKRGKAEALLPRVGGEAKAVPPDEEEEEEYE